MSHSHSFTKMLAVTSVITTEQHKNKRHHNVSKISCTALCEIQRRTMGIWSLIRRMQHPNRMTDFLTKRIDSNRFAQNESANRFESRIGMLYLECTRKCLQPLKLQFLTTREVRAINGVQSLMDLQYGQKLDKFKNGCIPMHCSMQAVI